MKGHCREFTCSELQALPPTSGRLLGFMWTSCVNSQFVIVTTLGLKCFTLGKQALHSSKACKALEDYANSDLGDVVWYKYQHHSRILIMATQFDLAVLQITGQARTSHSSCKYVDVGVLLAFKALSSRSESARFRVCRGESHA